MKKNYIYRLIILLACLVVFPATKTLAHGVQVGYCQLSNGFVRIYVEHWHGNLSNPGQAGTMNISTTYGTTTVTQNLYPTGVINNTAWNGLSGCGSSINIVSGCTGEANTNNDWVYFDFAPAACDQQIAITLNTGNTVVLREACSNLYPVTITTNFADNAPPVITCQDINIESCSSVVVSSYNVTAVDACDNNPTLTYTIAPGSTFAYGTTSVTATATDNKNQSASCTFNVNVKDNTPPTAVCQNATVYLDCNGEATLNASDIDNGSSDNCGIASMSVSPASFNCDDIGYHDVLLTVTDVNNNSSTCGALVQVLDTSSPVLLAGLQIPPSSKTISQLGRKTAYTGVKINNGNTYALVAPGATVNIKYSRTSSYDGGAGCPGCITQHYVGINGVFSLCHNANGGSSNVNYNFTAPTTPGVYYITQRATWWYYCNQFGVPSNSNNPNVAIAVIVVKGENLCGEDIEVETDQGLCGAIVNFDTPIALDNCSATVSQTAGYASGSTFPLGETTVAFQATDASNNSTTCSFTVSVKDVTPPTAKCQAVSVTLSGGTASVTANDIDDGSSDACGIKSLSIDNSSFDCNDIGLNEVTLTVVDNNDNESTCKTNVTVIGAIPSCDLAVTHSDNTYTGGVATNMYLGYGSQVATVSCNASGGSSFSYSWSGDFLSGSGSSVSFTPTAAGNYTLTCTVTNNYGCVTTCTVTICVKDIRVPGKGKNTKVYICHVPPGNPNNAQTLSVSTNAVASHLSNHSGDGLGACSQTCGSNKRQFDPESEVVYSGDHMHVNVYPNPSKDDFTFEVETDVDQEIAINIVDMTGKSVLHVDRVMPHQLINLGAGLASGMYMARVRQGENLEIIKITKSK